MKAIVFFLSLLPLFGFSQTNCGDITEEKDQFDGKVTFFSPLLEPVSFTKVLIKGYDLYYIRLSTPAATLNFDKGVIILLENGERIERLSQEVDMKYDKNTNNYEANAFMYLKQEEVDKLTASPIKAFRLYIYDQEKLEKAKNYQDYLKCLIDKK